MQPSIIQTLLDKDTPTTDKVRIQGWVRSCRHSKGGFSFIQVNDGSCLAGIQVIAADTLPHYSDSVTPLTTGSSVDITGRLVSSSGRGQAVEIQADAVVLVGDVEHPQTYPVAKKRHSFEHLRTVAHLRTRTNSFGAITRLRNTAAQNIHRYFDRQGFIWVNTPIITASDCEGAGELFKVSALDFMNLPRNATNGIDFNQDFFGEPTYLTVSGQLQAEAYCLAFSRVYAFGPTFRAEHSNTNRHLAEFWMIEPEVAFADLEDNIALAEDFLKSIGRAVLEERTDDMAFFADYIDQNTVVRLEQMVDASFERLDYTEAIHVLEKSSRHFEFPVAWGIDLQSEHERYLTEEHVGKPVVITNYPKEIKAFYMRENPDGKTVAAMDVLVPGIGEIIGGGQREERVDLLAARLKAKNLHAQLNWYLDLRRYGTTAHAGFGLGFERLLSYVSGMRNIRDVMPFPRTPGNANF